MDEPTRGARGVTWLVQHRSWHRGTTTTRRGTISCLGRRGGDWQQVARAVIKNAWIWWSLKNVFQSAPGKGSEFLGIDRMGFWNETKSLKNAPKSQSNYSHSRMVPKKTHSKFLVQWQHGDRDFKATKQKFKRLWKSFKPVNLLCSTMAFKRCWVYVANLILMSFVVRILSLTLEKESLTTQCYLQKETTLYRRDTRHQAP